jgi:hypothetical protein
MNKLFKEIFEGFNKAQDIARQISKANEPKEIKQEVTEEEIARQESEEDRERDEIEYTCCGVEITNEIRDNDLCPKCLEHL